MLFLHGSGGNREDLLLPAIELASRGFVTMTISQPNDARRSGRSSSMRAAHSICLLRGRDVDPTRLGVVGFSLGAQTAAILAGDEPAPEGDRDRLGARRGRARRYWIRKAHAPLFFQAGTTGRGRAARPTRSR